MTYDVVVIGAGLAGLQCARNLQRDGVSVALLEKSRGVSGRCATRRWEGVPVDHGAQFFTARDPAFIVQVEDWLERGVCHVWGTRMHRWQQGALAPDAEKSERPHYVCREGMSALGKDLASGLEIRLETKVLRIAPARPGWRIEPETGNALEGARLVCTAPMPQVCGWFAHLHDDAWLEQLDRCREEIAMLPCLALFLHCPHAAPDWLGIHVEDEAVSWIAHDSSKRPADSQGRFIVHASPAFSQRWQDADLDEAARLLLERANEITQGTFTDPVSTSIHRWRYARATRALHQGATTIDAPAPLVLAGDAHHSERVSGAWLSGHEAAAKICS